jgi:protein-S-isoprenylcysteine O-methyltransferase Ste14
MIRYFGCSFVGAVLSLFWVSGSLHLLPRDAWWAWPLSVCVGVVLFGGGMAIGVLWGWKDREK